MPDIHAISKAISNLLSAVDFEANHVIHWQANAIEIDFAYRLHRAQLDESQTQTLIDSISKQFEFLAEVTFANGYLNLRLNDQAWLDLLEKWCQNHGLFLEAAGLNIMAASAPAPGKKMLLAKDMHFLAHARAISEIPGWQIGHEANTTIDRNEVMVLKDILRLGTGKAGSDEERLRAAKFLVLALRKLWQNPILVPNAQQASSTRQKILHLGIIGAVALLGDRVLTAPVE